MRRRSRKGIASGHGERVHVPDFRCIGQFEGSRNFQGVRGNSSAVAARVFIAFATARVFIAVTAAKRVTDAAARAWLLRLHLQRGAVDATPTVSAVIANASIALAPALPTNPIVAVSVAVAVAVARAIAIAVAAAPPPADAAGAPVRKRLRRARRRRPRGHAVVGSHRWDGHAQHPGGAVPRLLLPPHHVALPRDRGAYGVRERGFIESNRM